MDARQAASTLEVIRTLMERFPQEAVRVNVGGTAVVLEMARRHGAQYFVLVSTDKAVEPHSVMGATKRIAEMLVVGGPRTGDGASTEEAGPLTLAASEPTEALLFDLA